MSKYIDDLKYDYFNTSNIQEKENMRRLLIDYLCDNKNMTGYVLRSFDCELVRRSITKEFPIKWKR